MRFSDQSAVVTGAGQGLGRATARRLASEGAAVAILDVNAETAAEVRDEIEAAGGHALDVQADVTNRAEVHRAIDVCVERFGQLDVLVNNAGIGRLQPFLDSTDEHWREVFEVNLLGPFIVAQEVGRHMIRTGGGRIVNVASICAHWANSTATAYSAMKAGLLALTRGIAMELGPFGVTCNTVSPGPMDNELLHSLLSEEEQALRLTRSPLRRMGSVDEVAAAIAFLASPDSSYVNGGVLNVDGGLLIAGMPDGPAIASLRA